MKLIVEFEMQEGCLYRVHQIAFFREILARFYMGVKKITIIRPYEEEVKLD